LPILAKERSFPTGDDLQEAALMALIRAAVKHNLAKAQPARKKQ
jgi:hypothetical protein